MIEAFFFNQDSLFGCYHPPSDHSANRLAVICPPFFDEYRRCYRGIAELAHACATQGMHVLRFDYFGTAESFGELNEVSDLRWVKDIEAAIEEGLALTGADSVVLAGIRFGATLAAQCKHSAVNRLVACEPMDSGESFLTLMEQIKRDNQIDHTLMARQFGFKPEQIDYSQFRLNDSLMSALKTIEFEAGATSNHSDVQIIATSKTQNDKFPTTFAGVDYHWPRYHNGEFVSKPLLETIAKKVLEV